MIIIIIIIIIIIKIVIIIIIIIIKIIVKVKDSVLIDDFTKQNRIFYRKFLQKKQLWFLKAIYDYVTIFL